MSEPTIQPIYKPCPVYTQADLDAAVQAAVAEKESALRLCREISNARDELSTILTEKDKRISKLEAAVLNVGNHVLEKDREIEQMHSVMSKWAWHRDGIGPDVPVLQKRYDALRASLAEKDRQVEHLIELHVEDSMQFTVEHQASENLRQELDELRASQAEIVGKAWERAISILRDKAEQWQAEGERWDEKAMVPQVVPQLQDLDIADRDQCFAKMFAAKILICDFEVARIDAQEAARDGKECGK